MSRSIVCSICGSKETKRIEREKFDKLTLGCKFRFKEVSYKCNNCEEEYYYSEETDKNYLEAEKKAKCHFVKDSIECLSKMNISMAYLERVFELPIRTLTRWKNGDFSSSAIALLRLIVTYPWIIKVAEHKFERECAKNIVIKVGIHELTEMKNSFSNAIETRTDNALSNRRRGSEYSYSF